MKKTVTTILSLALALIMVSSLGNGVNYAQGKKDRDDKVVILDCEVSDDEGLFVSMFAKSSSVDIILPVEEVSAESSCVENVAFLLSQRFKMEDVSTIAGPRADFSRYTFVKK